MERPAPDRGVAQTLRRGEPKAQGSALPVRYVDVDFLHQPGWTESFNPPEAHSQQGKD
jgi:hypothetical protein